MGVRKVDVCKKCLMPNTRPRIVFDENGVCNACNHAEAKDETNWGERKKEFLEILDKYRSKDGSWDCIVPWSGGKDSSSIAYKLKYEFNMNPLLITFSPMVPNDVGSHNREAMIKAGFDHLFFRADQKTHRKLAKRFFVERGNLKVAWDAGINAIPVQVAVKFKIPLIFYAEHGESEYGGKVINEESTKIRDFTEVIEHQIGDDPRNWVDDDIDVKNLNSYIYPSLDEVEAVGVKALYFSYFFKWSMFDNYNYIKDKIGFELAEGGRSSGTFTNFDSLDDKADNIYYYMQYVKFGFGRCIRDSCRFIQNGNMTREEALEAVKKYDGEFPEQYFDEMLDYLQLSREEFIEIVDKHRNQEIWQNDGEEWRLTFDVQ